MMLSRRAVTKIQATVVAAIIIIAAIIGAVAYWYTTGPPPPAEKEPIKIGILADFTGPAAYTGVGLKAGVLQALEEINETYGGLLGRPIELIWADTKNDPTEGVNVVTRLITVDKVVAIIGGMSTTVVNPVMEIIADYQVPFLSDGVSSQFLPDRVRENYERYKYYFHVGTYTTNYWVDFMLNALDVIRNFTGFDKVALFSLDVAFSNLGATTMLTRNLGLSNPFNFTLPGGYARYPPSVTDFTPELDRAEASGAQILVFLDFLDPTCSLWIRQWREQQRPFIIGIGDVKAYDPAWLATTNNQSDTEVFPGPPYWFPSTGKTQAFWDAMIAQYGTIPFRSTEGYDTLWILADAIQRAGTTDADALVAALEETEFEGVALTYTFDTSHATRWTLPWYATANFVQQWNKNTGRPEIIWPLENKTADFRLPEWL